MYNSSQEMMEFLLEETEKYSRIMEPVNASFLTRLLKTKLPVKELHPNPDDEFCREDIGPNFSIINDYEQEFRKQKMYELDYGFEPLIVQKILPDGYMILNGHHRWAAALRQSLPSLPVKIVNLTQRKDILQMMQHSENTRLVALDLDEVILCGEDESAEKRLPQPFNRIFPERIRKGMPDLIRFFSEQGLDIWVYSAEYRSWQFVQRLLRHYGAPVTGVITGTARKGGPSPEEKKELQKMMESKYSLTLHVDMKGIIAAGKGIDGFEEHTFPDGAEQWEAEVKKGVKELLRA